MPPSSSTFYALINGVGSGTGRATALRFSQAYPVVLLARRPDSFQPIVDEINAAGGKALGIAADAADPAAVDGAFEQIARDLPGARLAAAVYNVNAGFAFASLLDLKLQDLETSLGAAAKGLFLFAQKAIPQLLDSVSSAPHPPTLIVTGATASIRGSAKFGSFAAGKFAQRALVQSMAREFGPRGVHVALSIVDGGIDVPWAKDTATNERVEDSKIKPEAIADSYWHLHTQPRSCFTQELDMRPYVEKW